MGQCCGKGKCCKCCKCTCCKCCKCCRCCCKNKKKAAHSASSSRGRLGSSSRDFPGAGDIRSSKENKIVKKRKKTSNDPNSNMSSLIHTVQDKDDFTSQLKEAGSKLVVVDFYATWCGPCKMISPKLEEFAQQMMADVVFLKVDVDECEEVATEYNISCMPTFILIKNSDKVDEFSGANAEKLKELIQKNI